MNPTRDPAAEIAPLKPSPAARPEANAPHGETSGTAFSSFTALLRPAAHLALLRWAAVDTLRVPAWQALGLLFALCAVEIGFERLAIDGPARFHPAALFWWSGVMGLEALLVWLLVDGVYRAKRATARACPPHPEPRQVRVGNLLGVSYAAALPAVLLILAFNTFAPQLLEFFSAPRWARWGSGLLTGLGWATLAYFALVSYRIGLAFFAKRCPSILLMLLSFSLSLASGYAPTRFWYPDYSNAPAPEYMTLTQESFERQQQLLQAALNSIPAGHKGQPELYAVIYAPYAGEDVFLNEARTVADVLQTRFGAHNRVVQLVNHAKTADSLPWATPRNLRQTVAALTLQMNPEDVLLVYATSHGGQDASLSSEHYPLTVEKLKAVELAQMLSGAGSPNRVLIVSACYSGGWLDVLQDDNALVMSAADAEHTSYGCGHKSDLTYFGRALFNEALRHTYSFTDAFQQAVPVIRQREEEADKNDGFSNPQIRVGAKIGPVLQKLEDKLRQAAKERP